MKYILVFIIFIVLFSILEYFAIKLMKIISKVTDKIVNKLNMTEDQIDDLTFAIQLNSMVALLLTVAFMIWEIM